MPKRCTRCQKELTSGQIICLECANELKAKPTLDECIKEWEERGWKVSKHAKHIVIKFNDNPIDGFIHISRRFEKTYIRCVLSYDLIYLLSKTLKALEVEKYDR